MNERIRELAEQAGLSHMPSNYPDMADLYKGADFELEKFAELIIRECAVFVNSQTSDNGYGVADSWCQGKDLLEHFGVKE